MLPRKWKRGQNRPPKFFSGSFQFLAELRALQPPLCIKKPLCEAVLRVLAGSCTQNSTPFHIFSFFMKTHTHFKTGTTSLFFFMLSAPFIEFHTNIHYMLYHSHLKKSIATPKVHNCLSYLACYNIKNMSWLYNPH